MPNSIKAARQNLAKRHDEQVYRNALEDAGIVYERMSIVDIAAKDGLSYLSQLCTVVVMARHIPPNQRREAIIRGLRANHEAAEISHRPAGIVHALFEGIRAEREILQSYFPSVLNADTDEKRYRPMGHMMDLLRQAADILANAKETTSDLPGDLDRFINTPAFAVAQRLLTDSPPEQIVSEIRKAGRPEDQVVTFILNTVEKLKSERGLKDLSAAATLRDELEDKTQNGTITEIEKTVLQVLCQTDDLAAYVRRARSRRKPRSSS